MNCPKCVNTSLLSVLSGEGFPLDFCQLCHGIWFDKGEAAKHFTIESDIPNLEAALKTARKTGLSCPRCSGELEEMKYHDQLDMLIDRCPSCSGLWFDFHETEKLARWAAEQESPRTRLARAVQNLKENDYKIL
jgi:Zn-finger nucleic acid-binding protein